MNNDRLIYLGGRILFVFAAFMLTLNSTANNFGYCQRLVIDLGCVAVGAILLFWASKSNSSSLAITTSILGNALFFLGGGVIGMVCPLIACIADLLPLAGDVIGTIALMLLTAISGGIIMATFLCFMILIGGGIGGNAASSKVPGRTDVFYDADGNPHYVLGNAGSDSVVCTDGITWRRGADGHYSER